jgi:hypothetical protein
VNSVNVTFFPARSKKKKTSWIKDYEEEMAARRAAQEANQLEQDTATAGEGAAASSSNANNNAMLEEDQADGRGCIGMLDNNI